ncbi:PP2C family protein-serine/threonine phosphatase [Pseudooceanicola sp. 502str34]
MTTPQTRSPVLKPMAAPLFSGAGLTHTGRQRDENEDSILTDPAGLLWAIADGMGGHGHGAMASDMVIDQATLVSDHAPPAPTLRARLQEANRNILLRAQKANYGQMGATAVLMLIQNSIAHVAWAGDCRAYLMRRGHLRLLTRDHTVVQEMVDEGLLDEAERNRHPQRHVVTRAVGAAPSLEVDVISAPLVPDDRLLLCSDGLTACLADQTIAGIVEAGTEPKQVCADLVRATLEAGAPDNVSVICVFVSGG